MLLDHPDRFEAMLLGRRGTDIEARAVASPYGSAPIMPLAWVIVSSQAR